MSFSIPSIVAFAAPVAPAAGAAPSGIMALFSGPMFFIIIMFGLMYFMMIRPQMKRQKEHRALIAGLAKGDEVVTNGGIAGRVEEVGETFMTVELAPNVRVKVQKGSVSQVLPKGSLKTV